MNCFLLLTCTFLAGMAAGILVTYLAMKAKAHYSGTLRVDRSDEDGPLLFLDLDEDISYISTQEEVAFRVENKNILPQD